MQGWPEAQKNTITKQPCWPVVWLWVFSVTQYAYRYILQVSDQGTSSYYRPTPPALSAVKYGIFLLFAVYTLFCALRQPAFISRTYRFLCGFTIGGLLALGGVLLIRSAIFPGSLQDTTLCALQLIPWIASVLLIPFVFKENHSVARTLTIFERLIFWIAFPFWLVTVILAVFQIRRPALSGGWFVRFGGILDDPNGYACLCLLLLVFCIKGRAGIWPVRATAYVVMLVSTLSFSGYITAAILCLSLLPSYLLDPNISRNVRLTRVCITATLTVSILAGLFAIWHTNKTLIEIAVMLYSAKDISATNHMSDLFPDKEMLDISSPAALLFGIGGFSENFYWRTLANFGWIGFLLVISTLVLWTRCAFQYARSWRKSIHPWSVAVLVGSNGIAYLLVFPLNLLYWSLLALLICGTEIEARTGRQAGPVLALT